MNASNKLHRRAAVRVERSGEGEGGKKKKPISGKVLRPNYTRTAPGVSGCTREVWLLRGRGRKEVVGGRAGGEQRKKKGEEQKKKNNSSAVQKRLPPRVLLIRRSLRTRFAGPIGRHFSHYTGGGGVTAAGGGRCENARRIRVDIIKTAKDKSDRLYQRHIYPASLLPTLIG